MQRRRTPLLVASLLLACLIGVSNPAGATVPIGFVDELVATVGSPTALAFTPDGRMLITTQQGFVRVVSGGTLLATPALNLGTTGVNVLCSESERGLLGIAIDPQFDSNGFVYLYYTFKKGGSCPFNSATAPVNRVSRFTMTGNTISFASELVLIDNIHSFAGNHNAGDVQFGKDGLLYISVGDGGCDYQGTGCAGANQAARLRHHLLGKILRITKDGAIPATNPYQGAGTARCNGTGSIAMGMICQETFSWGLRNPFRIAFDPNAAGTLFHINDVGQGTWEEIDLGTAGADYAWNACEGFFANGSTTTDCVPPSPQTTDPLFAYGHDGCNSITGGAFVPTSAGWPAPYSGSYLFSDFVCGRIWRLVNQGGGVYTRADFASNLGSSSAVHMTFGPSATGQALYYTTYASGGQVRRIRNTAGNTPPTAVLSASPTSGAAPLVVTLNGSGSSDPEGGPLSYQWTFGDGQSTTTSTSSIQHTYNSTGTFTASLTVVDNQGAPSQADTEVISVGNTPPSPTITSPAAGTLFTVGQTLTLTGSATDPQQGTLPDSALTWTVLRHHDTHTHPWFGPTSGNNLTFTAPAPEDLSATTNSYLEVILTATDAGGLSTTVTRNVMPKTVAITFATNPAGRTLVVNGSTIVGPTTITSWQGYVLNVSVPKQAPWKFVSWSDGGTKNHAITTPATATTYTATFQQGGGGGGGGCPPRC